MQSENEMNVEIEDCEDEEDDCAEDWIYVSQLSRKMKISQYKIKKWTREGLIPNCTRPGENAMYPEKRASSAIRDILDGRERIYADPILN